MRRSVPDEGQETNHVVRPQIESWRIRWVNAGEEDEEAARALGVAAEPEVEEEEEMEEYGARKVKKVQSPKEPTREEKEKHDKTHLPFRNWCRRCVRGRGKQMPHQDGTQVSQMNEVHMDYGFLGKEEEAAKTIPVLVAKERTTEMLMVATVPMKTTGTYVKNRVVGFLRETGCLHGDLVVKSDQEPAIKAVVEDVGRAKAADGSGRYIVEYSPVGSSQSNGMVERGIQSVAAQARVLLSAVQAKWGVEVPIDHPFVCYS